MHSGTRGIADSLQGSVTRNVHVKPQRGEERRAREGGKEGERVPRACSNLLTKEGFFNTVTILTIESFCSHAV